MHVKERGEEFFLLTSRRGIGCRRGKTLEREKNLMSAAAAMKNESLTDDNCQKWQRRWQCPSAHVDRQGAMNVYLKSYHARHHRCHCFHSVHVDTNETDWHVSIDHSHVRKGTLPVWPASSRARHRLSTIAYWLVSLVRTQWKQRVSITDRKLIIISTERENDKNTSRHRWQGAGWSFDELLVQNQSKQKKNIFPRTGEKWGMRKKTRRRLLLLLMMMMMIIRRKEKRKTLRWWRQQSLQLNNDGLFKWNPRGKNEHQALFHWHHRG